MSLHCEDALAIRQYQYQWCHIEHDDTGPGQPGHFSKFVLPPVNDFLIGTQFLAPLA